MDAYAQLPTGPDALAGDQPHVAWIPADDDLLPGRIGRTGLLVPETAPLAETVPQPDELQVAEPHPGLMLVPALPDARDPDVEPTTERDFWRRGLAPLPDFADVRALPDRSFDPAAD